MNSTIETTTLTGGFQPAIDLSSRAPAEENWLIFLGPFLALAAYVYCRYQLHGSIAWVWGVPYCRF
jgi:hypothetical protein